MSPVSERNQAMRMMLAEINPGAQFVIEPRVGRTPMVGWPTRDRNVTGKAFRLMTLRLDGPQSLVKCDAHLSKGVGCDLVPVSWALLGHTCGRAS